MLFLKACGVLSSALAVATAAHGHEHVARASAGETINYGYDSSVQYDYVVVGSGAG
jgi:hypothetical protein